MPKYNNNMMITVVDKKHCNDGEYFAYNKEALGEALGKLSTAGIRAYLYLAHNTSGKPWVYNSTAYANWLGMSRHSADTSFKDSALDNLIKFGYVREIDSSGAFEFSEYPKQEWIEEQKSKEKSQVVTKKSETSTQESEFVTEAREKAKGFNF